MAERAMPSFTKSPPELVARFGAVLERYPDVVRKQMFGYPAAFVGGNMATGLFADRWVVRLPDAEVDAAKAAGAGSFEPVPGRPMKAFVAVPPEDVEDDARIARWVERGLATAAAMPAKKK
jgi:TfoX/Sxy family transcriptional regulator of competence genes